MKPNYSEDSLVEQPAIALFAELGWQTADCYHEIFGPQGSLGREAPSEVVLLSRLQPALECLNPSLPSEALQLAIEELTRDRSLMSMAHANREVYQLLKDGVKVTFRDVEGNESFETVYLIDWKNPKNNDYFLASQFWVSGDLHSRRPDLIGFVNGIPLIFVELKTTHVHLINGYKKNLRDYKDTIPHLFWYNAVLIISNGSATRVGSITAPWEHFNEWKKINAEGEEGIVSLETAIRGICQPARLLDIVENFTLFAEKQGGLQKLVAKNHQYLGTNNAFDAVQRLRENQGKLGVFWHTQGSGKSYSMIFFAQKVLRQLPGNWTFVIITDRRDLDDQIYKNFAGVGAVTVPEERVRAQSGEHLKQLLEVEDHRYVFTLIQKFHTEIGETYPMLSERSDIIVLTDEAHRSQYDILALNMRNALPHAAFLAFTGTPLMIGEERTKDVFGKYVSIYNFAQSVEDNATVPLYYENRIPELQLTNENLNQDMERLLEDAELDDAQEARLEREFSREYHLITRNDRLEKVAEDIILHFMGRGFHGKAMVVCVDKATAVSMYDKVSKYWKMHLAYLQAELENCDEFDLPDLEATVEIMQETDMAVVVSPGQNEISIMEEKGLDIRPHRRRMLEEDLDTKFKDPDDPFRIVFVCAMWMTGFDVPSCSTIYLDKPMRNHTLMQTIARANRVWGEKVNGLIVDYIGVFGNLQRALAIYGTASGGGVGKGDLPVETKGALVEELEAAIQETREYLSDLGVELDAIQAAAEDTRSFSAVAILDDGVDAILVNDDTKRGYLALAGDVDRLFEAILPDPAANQFGVDRKAITVIADKIRNLTPPADISDIMGDVEDLLDDSIAPKGYVIREPASGGQYLDLSRIDFEALEAQFAKSRKRIEVEKLRGKINSKLAQMIRLNKSRMNYYQKFQELIDEYNAGAKNVDAVYAELLSFAQSLNEEEQRGIAEQLSEEELALFDLLTRPAPKLGRKELEEVKAVARKLLDTLKAE
ncbi:MAG: type I restriction endonuclease subunit R, partial [Chloroflexi bacterium]|nr:type I restriction endonuclease subunit R [Chloroflexota bacterium]